MFSRCLTISLLVILIIVPCAFANDAPREGGCFSIVVGKSASADGWVIMAHNEDDFIPQVVNHYKIPRQTHAAGETVALNNGATIEQASETWSYIHSEIPGLLFSDSYLSEWGVCVCSDACPSREDTPELSDGGITSMLRRIVAERARTSREGVHIAANLVERFGYGASGRTYIISDPNEGWLFCAVNGKRWVAQRVPDDQIAMIANSYSVHQIDLSDTMNFLGSADIIDYAVTRGWYDPKSGVAFDFAAAYADPAAAADLRNLGRQWDGYRHVAMERPDSSGPLPFALVPKDKLGVRQIMGVLRSHYEESSLYATDSTTACPHGNPITPICRNDTQTSFVAQLRGDMPTDIGLVYWTTLSSPCASCYLPFYFGIDSFPSSYWGENIPPTEDEYAARIAQPFTVDDASAFWTFTTLRHAVEQHYPRMAPTVRAMFDSIETDALSRQSGIDAQALSLYIKDRKAALSYPSAYTSELLAGALTKIRHLQVNE